MTDLIIHNCDLLSLKSGKVKIAVNQDIAITGNRIESVIESLKDRQGESTAGVSPEIIEGRGLLAIPGLINTHAHISMALFRGLVEDVTIESWFNEYIFPLESNLTPEDVYWGALLGIAEMIENGITSVADQYFFMDEVAKAIDESGMRANLSWGVFGHEDEAKLERTCKFVERWQGAGDGRITTWLGPHAPYTTGSDFLRLSAKRAKDLGVGIQIHVSETAEQVASSLKEFGITPVKMLADTGVLDLPTILGHCLYPTKKDLDILSAYPTGVAHAPKTYLKLGMGIISLADFRRAGVPIGLATDGAVSSNTLDILEQLRLMVLTQKHTASDPTVMPVAEALDIAFNGSARVMHMEEELGAILPGKLADIVLLRQDGMHVFPRYDPAANLIFSSRASDVDTVICNGKVLLRAGRLLTIDKDQVKHKVAERLDRLSQRVPGKQVATYPV